MLDGLPAELVIAVGEHLCQGSSAGLLPLAQTCCHSRRSILPVLYHNIAITSSRQLQLFVSLLAQLPPTSPLDPAYHIRSLRLGPRDTLASASEASRYFSSINSYPSRTEGKHIDERWMLTARILERCISLQDLVIWDGLLGDPTLTARQSSKDRQRYGLGALHPDARLQSLALPFLWRGGANLPSPHEFPQLAELEQLDVVNSGLTTNDIRTVSHFYQLKLFRWYYRPLGMIELELLLETLTKCWKEESRQSRAQDNLQVFLAANNGMLAQIEGYLISQTPGFIFVDPYLMLQPDSRVPSPEPPRRTLPPQVMPTPLRRRSQAGVDPPQLDQYEINFLFHRRRAGMQGFAPGAAPQLPQAWVDHLKALQQQQLNQDPSAAPVQAPPILGGFPTESAEDQFARRIMEREKRLERQRLDRLRESRQEQDVEATHDAGLTAKNGVDITAAAAAAVAAFSDPSDLAETWISTAVTWFHSHRLLLDRVRWKRAVAAWESEWELDEEEEEDEDDAAGPDGSATRDQQPPASSHLSNGSDAQQPELEEGLAGLLLSQLAEL